MYAYVLLQRLQSRYDPVVLALQSGSLFALSARRGGHVRGR
jgi:membrane protease YdiL (CAAX protease family)